MSKQKTHWKSLFDYDYLGSHDLENDQELIATIAKVEKRALNVPGTGKTEEKPVLVFAEKIKPMVLNATNSRMITSIANSNYIDDWKGVKVTIYVDQNIRFGKETVEGLRIKPSRVPAKKSETDILNGQLRKALAALSPEAAEGYRTMLNKKRDAGELTVDVMKGTLVEILVDQVTAILTNLPAEDAEAYLEMIEKKKEAKELTPEFMRNVLEDIKAPADA